jgi:hypothetical protein
MNGKKKATPLADFRVQRNISWSIRRYVADGSSQSGGELCSVPNEQNANEICLQLAEAYRLAHPDFLVKAFPYQSEVPRSVVVRPVNHVGIGVRSAVRLESGMNGIVVAVDTEASALVGSVHYVVAAVRSPDDESVFLRVPGSFIEYVYHDDIFAPGSGGYAYEEFKPLKINRLLTIAGSSGSGKTSALLGQAIVAAMFDKQLGHDDRKHVILSIESTEDVIYSMIPADLRERIIVHNPERGQSGWAKSVLRNKHEFCLYVDSANMLGFLRSPAGLRFEDEDINLLAEAANTVTIAQMQQRSPSLDLSLCSVTYGPRHSYSGPNTSQIPKDGKKK